MWLSRGIHGRCNHVSTEEENRGPESWRCYLPLPT